MDTKERMRVEHAMETIAKRDGISPEEIRGTLQEAILEAQKNLTPRAELLWRCMTPDGTLPSPEELIVWVINVLVSGDYST